MRIVNLHRIQRRCLRRLSAPGTCIRRIVDIELVGDASHIQCCGWKRLGHTQVGPPTMQQLVYHPPQIGALICSALHVKSDCAQQRFFFLRTIGRLA